MSLRGLVAIITGASGGIGSATARAFAAAGCSIVLAALDDDALSRLYADLQRFGVPVLAVPTDVTDRAQIDAVVQRTMHEFGRIDILANVAGIGSSPALCDCTDEEIERVVAVNLLGTARMMHAVIPVMKAQGSGSIINVGSIAGEIGIMGVYTASKFGVRGLTDTVRREVKAHNIDVTLVQPGFVRTAMNAAMGDRLPGPEIVADEIVRAVGKPRRGRIVPFFYHIPVFFAKSFPALTDVVLGNARIQQRLNRDARAARAAARLLDE